MYDVIDKGESERLAAYFQKTAELKALIDGRTSKQREAAKMVATLFADAALTKPVFDGVVLALAETTGAHLELDELGKTDKHGETTTG